MSISNLLTVDEFAEWTRLSPSTIRRKVESGEIRSLRFGERSIRIPAPELPEFMAKSAVVHGDPDGESNQDQVKTG
jgi:excisionase family DNA binding protein